jgi:hypothetical protein
MNDEGRIALKDQRLVDERAGRPGVDRARVCLFICSRTVSVREPSYSAERKQLS